MKKAIIYTRTAVPNTASNKKQEQICLRFARENGFEVVCIYTDNGFSGMNARRSAFRQIMASRTSKDWDIVIIYDCARFFLKTRSFIKYLKILRQAGKDIFPVTGAFGDLPAWLLPYLEL